SLCLSFFSSVSPRPPSPTFLPYTTLFRSLRVVPARDPASAASVGRARLQHPALDADDGRRALRRTGRAGSPGRGRPRLLPAPQIDRKSTRLNSSHGSISYAVFFLKQKKTA